QIDACHERPAGTAKRNFTANRRHLIAGEDYWDVCGDEIRTRNLIPGISPKVRRVILLNESGYLMVTKSFTDDRAWAVHRAMVRYFKSGKVNTAAPVLSGRDAVNHMADALQDPAFMAEALHQMIIKAQVLQEENIMLRPKAAFHDQVTASQGSMTVKRAAQLCGTGQNRMFRWLRDHHYLQGGNQPYQKWLDQGLFETRLRVFNLDGSTFTRTQPLITPKGLARFQRELGCGQAVAFELDANVAGS
uniref:phage antirepressor KilAC domain-containing protein n=1 Tax=Stomatohabitans albus TaxID=3110766 RepID=UPI00300D2CFC